MSCKDKDGGTHHYACDCREESFRKLESSNKRMREALAGLYFLIENEVLVRNTNRDDNATAFLMQGMDLVQRLNLAKAAL